MVKIKHCRLRLPANPDVNSADEDEEKPPLSDDESDAMTDDDHDYSDPDWNANSTPKYAPKRPREEAVPYRPHERTLLVPWLRTRLDANDTSGLDWTDKEKGEFSVCWIHGSQRNWDANKHSAIFEKYAIHTGRYRPGDRCRDTKKWKANFRCAINVQHEVKEIKGKCRTKGVEAKRYYRFVTKYEKTSDEISSSSSASNSPSRSSSISTSSSCSDASSDDVTSFLTTQSEPRRALSLHAAAKAYNVDESALLGNEIPTLKRFHTDCGIAL